MSELALKLIAECKKTKSPKLDLGNCGLKDLNEIKKEIYEIGEHLEELNFCNQWVEWIGTERKNVNSLNLGLENYLENVIDLAPLKQLKILRIGGVYNKQWPIQNLDFIVNNYKLHTIYAIYNLFSDISPFINLGNLISLDFSGNQVTDISPISNLKKLSTLKFSINQVSDISPIVNLRLLSSLNFSSNLVSDISSIKSLTKLSLLYFSYNKVSDISPLYMLETLSSLDFSSNKVIDISPVVNLNELTYLDFSFNFVSDISPLVNLEKLTTLNFKETKVTNISALFYLEKLTNLNFKDNKVSNISSLTKLENLNTLDFSSNKITDLSPLKNLCELTSLNFSVNQVTDISPLNKLEKLSLLNFSYNKVSDISHIINLHQLTTLEFSINRVSDISPIKNLERLTFLYFRGNKVSDLTPLLELHQLVTLDLGYNQVSVLEPLKRLSRLRKLLFNDNQVSDLSPIKGLINLNYINFSNNKVSNLNPLKGLFFLNSLDFINNFVSDLSSVFGWLLEMLDKKFVFSFEGNPIQNPPLEVLVEGNERLKRYIEDYLKTQNVKLDNYENNELKIIILGNPNTGKTHLANFLASQCKELPINNSSTHGLTYLHYYFITTGKTVRINLLDFGGQEYYHDTHHLFFTYDTLYLVLWNSRSDHYGEMEDIRFNKENNNEEIERYQCYALPYWIDAIKQLRVVANNSNKENEQKDDSNNIIETEKIVNSKIDNEPTILLIETWRKDKSQSLPDFSQLNHEMATIQSFNSINLQKKENEIIQRGMQGLLENLNEAINSMLLGKWPGYYGIIVIFFRKFLEDSNNVKNEFPEMSSMFIHLDTAVILLNNILRKADLNIKLDNQQTQDVLQFLANRGYLLYFSDAQICINPEELTSKIYNILDKSLIGKSIIHKKDILEKTEGAEIFPIMLERKLLIPHPDGEQLILPQHLSSSAMDDVLFFLDIFHEPVLVFEFRGYIQRYIIHEILFQFKDNILFNEKNIYIWKHGVIIKLEENSKLLIKIEFVQNENERKICLSVNQEKPDYTVLKSVKKLISDILKNKKSKIYVRTHNNPLVSYELLLECVSEKTPQIKAVNGQIRRVADYKGWEVLGSEHLPMKKVFISYSSKDSLFMQRLSTHLESLKSFGIIDYWHDRMIEAGSNWDDSIQSQIEESDIYICLLSADFLATAYVREIEIPKMKQALHESKGQKKLLLVLLKNCAWDKQFKDEQLIHNPEIKESKVLLTIGQPDNDDSWMLYVRELERLAGA